MPYETENKEYQAEKYYAKFGGRVVGPYDTEEDAYHDTKGDVEWIKKGQDLNVKKESFKTFFENIRKGGAGKSPYTGSRPHKDKKKENSKTEGRKPVKSEDEEASNYIGKNIVYATKDTSGGGATSFTSKGKVVDHNKQYDVITLDNGVRINTHLHHRKDDNLYHKGDFYIDSSVPAENGEDRCKRKADSVYGKKTSAYKSGAIVRCRKGKIWKKK